MASLGDVIRGMKAKPSSAKPLPTAAPASPSGPTKWSAPSAAFADSFRSFVLNWIDNNPRPSGAVAGSYLRASSINEVCGRREAILISRPELDVAEKFAVGSVLTMDMGSAMHRWWQNHYLGPAQVLWGEWFCHGCQAVVETGLMPKTCPAGHSRDALEYKELELVDDTLHYAGHPDGLLTKFGDAVTLLGDLVGPSPVAETLFELKSISSYGYEQLTEPLPEHRAQVHAYMRLLGVTSALVVYVDRGKLCDWSVSGGVFTAGRPHVKVYHLVFDHDYWSGIEVRIKEHWRARALMTREDPPTLKDVATFERICYSKKAPLAKKCSACDVCFYAETT